MNAIDASVYKSINSYTITPNVQAVELFDRLQAPLADKRLSSSASNGRGDRYLLVWRDLMRYVDGATWLMLGLPHPATCDLWRVDVQAVRAGAMGCMVLATPVAAGTQRRTIETIDEGLLVPIGAIEIVRDRAWALCLPPIAAARAIE
ncbi:hypothetical protein [Pseudomonas asiatica]|uniref:hypothetical protein n=1 Tax=Pseudomonas asiatica TaxID=2219225 RepID=UPI003B9DEB6C|nr:hypothetical protein [Pseudomonas shirazica]